jgi:branched-chain amino acid transport system permease protein
MNTLTDLRAGHVPEHLRRRILVGAAGLVVWALLALVLPNGAPPFIILLGVVMGSITSLLAMGLILIYRTNRIINFAYGAMGSLGGAVSLLLFMDHGVNYFVAIGIGVAVGVGIGALTDVLVIRRFANASRLVLTVATIGLAQVLGVIELLGVGGGLVGGISTPLGQHTTLIGTFTFSGDHALIVAVIPLVIAVLAWFLLRTDAGVAVRAAAENGERALLLGIPVHRLSTIVWMAAGGIAALTFVLRTGVLGSQPGVMMGFTFLLPALAAAVVARMESLPVAFGAGIGLGVLEQLVWWNADARSMANVFFLVVILVALLARSEKLSRAFAGGANSWSSAGAIRPLPGLIRRLPPVRTAYLGGGALLLGAAVTLPLVLDLTSSRLHMLGAMMIWGMVAVSLVVLTGWGGHISLGQFAFVGVGAVVTANLMDRFNADLFVSLVAAGAVGAVIALLLGLPALRIKGLFLAVTTLAFAVALDTYFLNPTYFNDWIPSNVDRPVLWERFDMSSQLVVYYVILAFLVLTILTAQGVRNSRTGRVLIATRDNENAAQAAAVPAMNAKLTAFMYSGAIAGIAGGLHVVLMRGIGVGSYGPGMSLDVFAMAVIGGIGSIGGALLGVFAIRMAEMLPFVGSIGRMLLTGAGLLVILYLLPGGLGQAMTGLRDRMVVLLVGGRGGLDPRQLGRPAEGQEDEPEDESGVLAGALSDDGDTLGGDR